MPEYFYTAVDADGRKHTDSVEAESAAEAVRFLEEEGCREIVLHSDDVLATVTNFTDESRRAFSPRELVALGRMRFPRFVLFILGKHFALFWWLYLLGMGFLVWRRTRETPWSELDFLVVGVLVAPLVIVPTMLLFGGSRKYDRLIQAVVLARWEEVLDRVEQLKDKLPVNEYYFRKAQAMIGLGEVEEGLRFFQRLEYTNDIPAWLYWSLRAELLFRARRIDEGLQAHEKAAETAPDNPTVLLDYADSILTYKPDVELARKLLGWAKEKPIGDLIRFALFQVEGMLALETGDAQAACRHFEQAQEEAQIISASPLFRLIRAKHCVWLCLSYAAAGNKDAARTAFAYAEPFLELHQRDDLLQRCREALK